MKLPTSLLIVVGVALLLYFQRQQAQAQPATGGVRG